MSPSAELKGDWLPQYPGKEVLKWLLGGCRRTGSSDTPFIEANPWEYTAARDAQHLQVLMVLEAREAP